MLLDLIPISPVEMFVMQWWPVIIAAVAALAIFAAVIIIKTVRKNKK